MTANWGYYHLPFNYRSSFLESSSIVSAKKKCVFFPSLYYIALQRVYIYIYTDSAEP